MAAYVYFPLASIQNLHDRDLFKYSLGGVGVFLIREFLSSSLFMLGDCDGMLVLYAAIC